MLPFANHSQNCCLQRNAAPENMSGQRLKSTPGHEFTVWVTCSPQSWCRGVIFVVDLVWTHTCPPLLTLHSRETLSYRATIQPSFLFYQVKRLLYFIFLPWTMVMMICLPGRKEIPAILQLPTWSLQSRSRTKCKRSFFGHGLQSTEALR